MLVKSLGFELDWPGTPPTLTNDLASRGVPRCQIVGWLH